MFDGSETAVYVTFDQELQPIAGGSFDAGTFRIEQTARRYQTGTVALVGGDPTTVRITAVNQVNTPGSPVLDYDSVMQTVIGVNGLRAPSFTGLACPAVP